MAVTVKKQSVKEPKLFNEGSYSCTNNFLNFVLNYIFKYYPMNKLLVVYLIVFINLIISCKNISTNFNTIDISKSLDGNSQVSLSSISTNIEYIQLQSDSNCFLGRIRSPSRNIQFFGNKIFISDGTKILSFDSCGNFLTQYGKQGRGPEEYQDIRSFTIMPDEEQVVILSSAMQKVLFYDINGKFLKDIRIDFMPIALTTFNNRLIFINPKGLRGFSEYYTLSIISVDGVLQNRLISRKNEKEIDKKEKIGLKALDSHTYVLNNYLHHWESLYDTIWEISSDFKIFSKNYIDYGSDKLPFKYILESNAKNVTIDELKNFVIFQYFFETSKYMFFELGNKGKLNHIYYDKYSKKSFNLRFNEKSGNKTYFSFYNDFDNGLPFWPDGVLSEEKVFSLIYGYDLKKYYTKIKNKPDKIITPQEKKIEDLISQTKLIDNPILMIITLK